MLKRPVYTFKLFWNKFVMLYAQSMLILINNKITLYCNMTDLLVGEQNGFHQDCSCEEHIYTNWKIRHQVTKCKSVFCIIY